MGFDDMRPRARVYDSWGLIGSRHGQAEPKTEPSLTDIIGDLAQQARATLAVCLAEPEEGGPCNKSGCSGTYELGYPDGDCCCHIHPPCGRCTSSYLVCAVCMFQPDEIDPDATTDGGASDGR